MEEREGLLTHVANLPPSLPAPLAAGEVRRALTPPALTPQRLTPLPCAVASPTLHPSTPPPPPGSQWCSSPRRCLGANSWKLLHPPRWAPLSHLTCFVTFCSRTQPNSPPPLRLITEQVSGETVALVKCGVKHLAG